MIKKENTIFIVTPCCNMVDYIDKTIRSIITQEGNFYIRYHIQDGGSTDGTVKAIEKWCKLLNKQESELINCSGIEFSYKIEKDTGMYDAIVKGFSYLDIPDDAFMTWLNADDILLPQTMMLVNSLYKMNDVDWITGNLYNFQEENGQIFNWFVPFPPAKYMAKGVCDLIHWASLEQEGTFWRKWLWDKAGGLNKDLQLAGDWDLWRRFARHSEVVQVNFPLAAFRKRPGQLSVKDGGSKYQKEINSIVPYSKRHAVIRKMAEEGTENLLYNFLNYSKDSYNIIRIPIRDKYPPWCTFFKEELERIKNVVFNTSEDVTKKVVYLDSVGHRNSTRIDIQKIISNSVYSLTDEQRLVIREIRNSGIFSYSYYLNNSYCEIKMDPLVHYVLSGALLNLNPSFLFDSAWYLNTYTDVKKGRYNPLFHYIRYGADMGYDPHPEFSTKKYLASNPEVNKAGLNPLAHYLHYGVLQGVDIN